METLIVIVYLTIVLTVGMLAGRRISGLEDFAVAGRSFGSMVIFATKSCEGFQRGVFRSFFCCNRTYRAGRVCYQS